MGRRLTVPLISTLDKLICTNCDLHVYDRVGATGGEASRSPVLFIKDITTNSEANVGTCFNNQGSSIIRKLVNTYLLNDVSIFTNLIRCTTLEFSEYTYNKCKYNLYADIRKYKPYVIVTIGKRAYAKITGDSTDWYKQLYKPERIGSIIVIPLPAMSLANDDKVMSGYINAFNIISKLVSIKHPSYNTVHYDYSEYICL